MKVFDYLKGIPLLIVIGLLIIVAAVLYFLFEAIVGVVVVLIAIIAILLLPYFIGKKYEPEKPGNYGMKKVK